MPREGDFGASGQGAAVFRFGHLEPSGHPPANVAHYSILICLAARHLASLGGNNLDSITRQIRPRQRLALSPHNTFEGEALHVATILQGPMLDPVLRGARNLPFQLVLKTNWAVSVWVQSCLVQLRSTECARNKRPHPGE